MERLAYTTQKTSDDNLNKGRFADKLDVYAIIGYAKDAAIGLIMGIGSFLVLLSTFGLSWSHTDWPYGGFIDGMINTWNIVAKHLAAQDGVFLPQLEVYDVENGFFLAMVLLFLIAVGVVISFSRNKGFIIFYALLVGLPSIIWGIHPSVLAVAVLAAGILLFIVNSDIRNIFQNYRGLIYAAIIAAAAFVLLCVPAVGKLADRPTAVDKFRENTQEKAVDSYYGTNPLHDGDLTVKSRGSEKGTALEVTMSNPESMYLRGFVGDVLTHDGWKPLSSATYYEDKNLFYWLGWLARRMELRAPGERARALLSLALAALALAGCWSWLRGGGSVSTAAAIDELRSGEAGAFRACADRRLTVLEDPRIRDAKLEPFPAAPWLLYYADIAEDPEEWINVSMAAYYGKDSVAFPGY